ncbi:ADP-ribosyl-[dinitrogen reductase] hydrolase [Geomonas sp. Red69]|uniref:ADP-ribosyl-[dinitrogen reductase] hydrolase n=1 Tax=Geomonas diazotrophica TaxID=2843197 RepID=A0ABX8JQH9_9BACT|nr:MULTISPECIES: ADP-ribosyl-[dinitrogen reductase] hydrolase [Geomonas]MBU5637569.1 ADP-ribosyl-[dinitrogen reductase] hydrolase [Geomonas diazotrophica]QWV99311.1 ADP-ribosyl-[dinitrogen reductase] hydrolase [Geomonas nitrogeniifigens]QXE88478.1 ADP-ribosyl-[dinitrogen reductase] hydrolase [Geomonas nitrogeniifigens]
MTTSSAHSDLISRARGAFLGLAVGDALGAPVEFMTRGEIRDKYGVLKEMVGGGWLRLKPGQVTDDTEMSLCLARATVKEGAWSLQAAADHLAGWLKSKPIDVGDTCRRGIRNYMLRGLLETPPNEWDGGNGAAMRTLPVALCALGNDQLLERIILQQAHLTHNHPYSDAASIYLGRLLHLALTGRSLLQLRRQADELISAHPSFSFEPYKGLASGYVVDTMQTVFHCFFKSRSFEACIVETVNQGGDADTTGAIAGAIAGAYYGEEAIPSRWKKKLAKELVVEIYDLAEQLVCMSPLLKSVAGDDR